MSRAPRNRSTATVVFLVALAVHVVAFFQYRADPFFVRYIADAASYDEMAARIAADGLTSVGVFHQAPLFPVVLSWLYSAVESPTSRADWAHLLQAALGSLAMAFLVPIARSAFGSPRAGVAAAVVAVLHAPFVYYDLKLLPVAIALATQTAALLALFAAVRRPCVALATLAGVGWGVAALARAESVLFVPLALVAVARAGRSGRRALLATVCGIGVVLGVAPATVHNVRQGDVVLVASAAGENLFVGNQRGAQGGHTALAPGVGDLFSQRHIARAVAGRELGREVTPSEVSEFWARRALDEIAADPAAWMRLEIRKLARVFDPGDPTDLYPFALERRHYLTVLWLLPVSCACLLVLAAIGLWFAARHRVRGCWPVAALAGVNLVAQLTFFTDSRLRVPLFFALVPFAGYAVSVGIRMWSDGRRTAPAAMAAVVLSAAIAGTVLVRPSDRDAVRMAAVLSSLDRLDEGLEVLAPPLRRDAPDSSVLDQAGWIRQKRGDLEEARGLYLRALDTEDSPLRARQTRTRLAMVCERLGQYDDALRHHTMAVESGEPSPGALVERGRFLRRRGDLTGARSDFRHAAALAPAWPDARRALEELDRR